MKIVTWNVNSLKIRFEHLLFLINEYDPDLICLQETKSINENFPENDLINLGYQVYFTGQKTFNGVAILSKYPLDNLLYSIPKIDDEQKRFIAGSLKIQNKNINIINCYFPNGQSLDSDKFIYKQHWINALINYLDKQKNVILVGDFNIAPHDRDCHDPEKWKNSVLTSDIERTLFNKIIDSGFIDTFRALNPDANLYSWWDYRMNGYKRKMGLRIDHILISISLNITGGSCKILEQFRGFERPSDHAPVILEFNP